MNKNKKACSHRYPKNSKQGFTLIEILIIIIIIAILVSVVLVSLMNSRRKAQDNAAFTSFKSLAAPAYMCLSSGGNLTQHLINNNICDNNSTPNSNWPEFAKTDWTYDDFFWCNLNLANNSNPTSCNPYDGVSCGGSSASGYFCFGMEKDGKTMWCTINGCRKEGF